MRDEDIRNVFGKLSKTKSAGLAKSVGRKILYILILILAFGFLWLYLEIVGIFLRQNRLLDNTYPLSNVIVPFIEKWAESSDVLSRKDVSMTFIAICWWICFLIGCVFPIIYIRLNEKRKKNLEYNRRNYMMYGINVIGAILYGIGYYKFWGQEYSFWLILIRSIFAFIGFAFVTSGIRNFVACTNELLAIVLSFALMLVGAFSFMFVFYSAVFVPLGFGIAASMISELFNPVTAVLLFFAGIDD